MPTVTSKKTSYWLHLVPIETREVSLLGAPVSGPGGASRLAKYPSFEPLRLLLTAVARVRPEALDDAAKALAAGESYALYDVLLTSAQLDQLGLHR